MSLQRFFSTKSVSGSYASLGLLILRIAAGAMMLTHGMNKLSNFSSMSQSFDPIGMGGPLSLSLVIFAEVFCSIAIIFGLFTKLAALPLVVAMCVAAFVAHAGDPLAAKELALLYLAVFAALLITGPGRYSIDKMIWK